MQRRTSFSVTPAAAQFLQFWRHYTTESSAYLLDFPMYHDQMSRMNTNEEM